MSTRYLRKIVASTEIFVREGQAEHTLVMLHGIGSNHSSFLELTDHLPRHYRLLVWNAPGYGNSAPLDQEKPQPGDYATKLHEIVSELNLSRFTLLGHSLGTLISVAYTRAYTAMIERLILVSCAQGYGMQPGESLPSKAQKRLTDLDVQGSARFAAERAPRLLYKPDANPHLEKAAVEAMASINRAGYAQAVHMLSAGDCQGQARQAAVDSLVVVGHDDQITPAEQSRAVHNALTEAAPLSLHTYKQVSEAGHLVHQEQAATVANHITAFLESASPPQSGASA